MFNTEIWTRPGFGRTPDGRVQVLQWLAMLAAAFVVVRWGLPLLGVVYPLLLVVAVFVTLGAVNMVFVGLMPRFERRAERWRDLWLPMLLATVFTVLELAAAAWLRSIAERLL